MNELEHLTHQLASRGYMPALHYQRDKWRCDLLCGESVLPVNVPRPTAFGPTAALAVKAAEAELAKLLANFRGRGGKVAA